MTSPKSLIINSPYDLPTRHWQQARDGTLTLVEKRRPAGYEIFDIRNNTRRTEPLDRVNEIRTRVDGWRAADYPGVTSVTRGLLEHWRDRTPGVRDFHFCRRLGQGGQCQGRIRTLVLGRGVSAGADPGHNPTAQCGGEGLIDAGLGERCAIDSETYLSAESSSHGVKRHIPDRGATGGRLVKWSLVNVRLIEGCAFDNSQQSCESLLI